MVDPQLTIELKLMTIRTRPFNNVRNAFFDYALIIMDGCFILRDVY